MKTLGDRIRYYRKNLRLSQKRLAELSGVSQPTIADLERNKQDTTRNLPAIAKALKVTVGQLDPEHKAQWIDVDVMLPEPKEPGDRFPQFLQALLEAVEGSYQMLGLDQAEAQELLKIVLEVAQEPPVPSSGGGFHRILSEHAVRKFLQSSKIRRDDA